VSCSPFWVSVGKRHSRTGLVARSRPNGSRQRRGTRRRPGVRQVWTGASPIWGCAGPCRVTTCFPERPGSEAIGPGRSIEGYVGLHRAAPSIPAASTNFLVRRAHTCPTDSALAPASEWQADGTGDRTEPKHHRRTSRVHAILRRTHPTWLRADGVSCGRRPSGQKVPVPGIADGQVIGVAWRRRAPAGTKGPPTPSAKAVLPSGSENVMPCVRY